MVPCSKMDPTSCHYFDKDHALIENGDTFNKNDEIGCNVLRKCVVCIVFIVLAIVLFIAFAVRHPKNYTIVGFAIASLLISLGCGIDVAVRYRNNPIHILYAVGVLLFRDVRTPPVLDPYFYFSGAQEFERRHGALKAEIMAFREENLPLTRDTYSGLNEYIGNDIRVKDGKDIGWRIFNVSVGLWM